MWSYNIPAHAFDKGLLYFIKICVIGLKDVCIFIDYNGFFNSIHVCRSIEIII